MNWTVMDTDYQLLDFRAASAYKFWTINGALISLSLSASNVSKTHKDKEVVF
jgi:hypothetical protein